MFSRSQVRGRGAHGSGSDIIHTLRNSGHARDVETIGLSSIGGGGVSNVLPRLGSHKVRLNSSADDFNVLVICRGLRQSLELHDAAGGRINLADMSGSV